MEKVRIGIVGIGTISGIYLKNLTTVFRDSIQIIGYSDLIQERADKAAETYGGISFPSNEALFAHPDIELVLNLTTPDAHALINRQALEAGKHAYCEKPLAVSMEDGLYTQKLAKEKGLYLGGAPDTFLGGGLQTCRKLIEDGWIGRPIGFTAFMVGHGMESWHPAPEFYYKPGAGPMFDMGPYYLTALVNMLGPIRSVSGLARKSFETRTITSQPLAGKVIDVEVPTHVLGLMDMECGAVGTIITSFDVWGSDLPRIEIYGTEGTLSVPDPNTFGGPVRLFRQETQTWQEVPLAYGYTENSRGLGLVDMAHAIREGREARGDVSRTAHVLEAMHAFHIASDTGRVYEMQSSCQKAEPLPLGLLPGQV